MNLFKKCVVILLMYLPLIIFSQEESDITLAKTFIDKYEDESAIILNSKVNITFNYNKKTEKIEVIKKIENEYLGLKDDYKTQVYEFYNNQSEIKKFHLYNLQTNNNLYQKYYTQDASYANKGIFYDDTRVKYRDLNFRSIGYKFQTEIVKKINDIKYFTSVFFNDDYVVLNKEIQIEIPKWLNLEIKEYNIGDYKLTKKNNEKEDLSVYNFSLKNINAMSKSKNVQGPTHIYPHLLFLSKSYTNNDIKYSLFENINDLYKWYYSLTSSLKNENAVFKSKVNDITINETDDIAKIKKIFYWVQDNIKYIAFEDGIAGFKPEEASEVFNNKYGDCKGMANLLKQMLLTAGYDARLSWLGTDRIVYDYSTPNLSVDNHMICSVKINDEFIFLDATEKYSAFKNYSSRIKNKQVLIEDGENFILQNITSDLNIENLQLKTYKLNISGDELIGTSNIIFKGENKKNILNILNDSESNKIEDIVKYYLSNGGDSNYKVSNIETSDLSDREGNLEIKYDLLIKNNLSEFDGLIYLDFNLNNEIEKLIYDNEKYNVDLKFSQNIKTITEISIPNNNKIIELPKNYSFENENILVDINFIQKNQKILFSKTIKIKNRIIKIDKIEEWNNTIKKIKDLFNNQIIISKN